MRGKQFEYLEEVEGVDEEIDGVKHPDKNFRKYLSEFQYYDDEEVGNVQGKIRSLLLNDEEELL